MQPSDLFDRLNDQPFKPFRVHLSDGSKVDVSMPGMIVIGESSVVMPTVWTKDDEGRRFAKHWRTVSIAHILQFGDIDETIEGKHRKRK
jgi:hypothetical protein